MTYRFEEGDNIFLITKTPHQVRGSSLTFSDVLMKASVVGFSYTKVSMFVRYDSGFVSQIQYGCPNFQPKPFSSYQEARDWWNGEIDSQQQIQTSLHNSTMGVLENMRVEEG